MFFLLSMFEIGSLAFWLLLMGGSCFLIFLVETEKYFIWPALITSALIGVLLHSNGIGFTELIENPVPLAGGFVGYFVCGALWVIVWWWRFVQERKDFYDETKRNFLTKHDPERGTKVIPDYLRSKWETLCNETRYSSYDPDIYSHPSGYSNKGYTIREFAQRPIVGKFKNKILTRMAWWPLSMLWTALNDPITKICKAIFARLVSTFQRITDHVYKGVEEDFKPVPPEKASDKSSRV